MRKGVGEQVDEALKSYRRKRRFEETGEPHGELPDWRQSGALYVVQKHDARRLHYDFRLELDGVLLSWAVTRGPSFDPKQKRLAIRTEDHPLDYGQFEGTIPKGNYGGGTVMLWDTGRWTPLGDARQGLEKGKLAFELHGKRLRGRWALVRLRPGPKDKKENWLLVKENDAFANSRADLLESETTSIVSGREMEELSQTKSESDAKPGIPDIPDFVEPMLARLVDQPPRGRDWLFEIKYDGYRALIVTDRKKIKIFTRSGEDWTRKFAPVADAVAELKLPSVLLDTEIVVVEPSGRTDFAALAAALSGAKKPLSCFVFDLLSLDGEDWRFRPLAARKARLKKLLGTLETTASVQYSEVFEGDGGVLLKAACAHGLEGIMAKRVDSPYRSGRHDDWLKIKCSHTQELVVIGFSASERRRAFASLLMAVQEPQGLRYAGRVGSGFSQSVLEQLSRWRDNNLRQTPPCYVPAIWRRGVSWVRPELVAQVAFAGWTRDGLIRHGRFIGLRADKKANAVKREIPMKTNFDITLTHPDRMLYPDLGVTKADVAAYIQAASPLMLPYMAGRFMTLVRCPNGTEKPCFFQRHLMPGFGQAWHSAEFSAKDGDRKSFIYFDKPEALLAAVQMGVLEFHIWGARGTAPKKPDRMVFDLDPDPSVAFDAVKAAAFRMRDVLDALGLQSLPLLSGGKGIHVVVPLVPSHEWPIVKDFAASLAARLVADAPDQFTATMSKAKRKGKIFIDHFRNEVGATAVAPFSPRARPDAAVAWPVSWAELEKIETANAMSLRAAKAAIDEGVNFWAGYDQMYRTLSMAAIKAIADPS